MRLITSWGVREVSRFLREEWWSGLVLELRMALEIAESTGSSW